MKIKNVNKGLVSIIVGWLLILCYTALLLNAFKDENENGITWSFDVNKIDYGLNYLVNVSLDSSTFSEVDTSFYSDGDIKDIRCYIWSDYALIHSCYSPQGYSYYCTLKNGEWVWIDDNLTEKTYSRINSYFKKQNR